MMHKIAEEETYLQVVVFHLGEEEFALDIAYVKEIVRLAPITRVPKCKEWIEGVINLRGNVVPVMDLRKRFHVPSTNQRQTRIIILELRGISLGVLVDAVVETRQIGRSLVEPAPALMSSVESEYIAGVAKLEDRLISLLQIDKILNFDGKEAV